MSGSPIPPQLVVGLGNPGRDYEATRHNVGFWWVERLAQELAAPFHPESRFHGEVARCGDLRLLKPTTFMNRSGMAVAALARFFRIPPEAILVVHDELDLPPGSARLKWGGGVAGHNGLKDIRAQLASDRFWRLRLGIGHPGDRNQVVHHVLHPPRPDERPLIEWAISETLRAWPLMARGEWPRAQQQIHSARPPQPPSSEESTP
ncbi:aminoacyl-tRNA hydrolase [Hydrogenophilus islandicus]